MNITHTFTIEKLQTEFSEIIHLYEEIQNQRIEIQGKLGQVKEIYNELIKNNNKKIFLFCLDAFYFQYKVLNIEMDNLNRFTTLINNRMYGDYYKLYTIMITKAAQYICTDCSGLDLTGSSKQVNSAGSSKQVDSAGSSKQVDSTNPISSTNIISPYNDLEPFHEYPIADTQLLHQDIIIVIEKIFEYYTKKEKEIHDYNMNKIGISIDSFINTLEYDNNLIQEQLQLYVNYISFFHKIHIEYLAKLVNKIVAFHSEIDEDMLSNNPNTDLDQNCEYTVFTIKDFIPEDQVNEDASYV